MTIKKHVYGLAQKPPEEFWFEIVPPFTTTADVILFLYLTSLDFIFSI